MTKYEFDFPTPVIDKNVMRLTNQIWKIIPMYENQEDWAKQLESVKRELIGWREIFIDRPQFLQIFINLESLTNDIEFDYLRKTVFSTIHLIQELKNHHD